MASNFQVTVDCADPMRLATFWATALDYKVEEIPKEWLIAQNVPQEQWNSRAAIVDPQGSGARFFFQQVPEVKTNKNRWHLDLRATEAGVSPGERYEKAKAKAEQLIAAGATRLYEMSEFGQNWITLVDPEGNEFCIG